MTRKLAKSTSEHGKTTKIGSSDGCGGNSDWKKEYAVLPVVDFDGSRVKIRNIRNFSYGSDEAILKVNSRQCWR